MLIKINNALREHVKKNKYAILWFLFTAPLGLVAMINFEAVLNAADTEDLDSKLDAIAEGVDFIFAFGIVTFSVCLLSFIHFCGWWVRAFHVLSEKQSSSLSQISLNLVAVAPIVWIFVWMEYANILDSKVVLGLCLSVLIFSVISVPLSNKFLRKSKNQ